MTKISRYILTKKNVHRVNNYFNSVKGSKTIPYGPGTKIIAWFCRSEFAREKYFKGKKKLFNEFLISISSDKDNESCLQEVFYANFLKGYKASSLSWLSQRKFKKYVRISGREYLDKPLKEGKGVILVNSHFGLAQAALPVFPMLGYDNFYTIVREKGLDSLKFEGLNKKILPKLLAFKDNSQAELFRQMYKAREVLKAGGIVHLLGDGYHGMSGNTINFLGKLRGFRPSYVDLAVATGAEVVPMFINAAADRRIYLDILPPLEQGDPGLSLEDKRKLMTHQYAEILSQKWIEQPWNVNWRFMEKHLYQVDAEE